MTTPFDFLVMNAYLHFLIYFTRIEVAVFLFFLVPLCFSKTGSVIGAVYLAMFLNYI